MISEYPEDGKKVPYLFGMADRWQILSQKVEFAKYFTEHEGVLAVHYFNGFELLQTNAEKAVEIAENYKNGIVAFWNKEREDRYNSISYVGSIYNLVKNNQAGR